ncbi:MULTISPECIES: LamG-like jellyroll fold domain-containing protein [unclassified Nocardia]|uniref:LamG-like jellyroll fold domain-containing protein n=1 Tax=unclassified Nocardia TaxID=2637762 RepID=UPI001CE3C1BE|nr:MULTISPECIES: LamG-like jellyroll fold domain-containing protein [unclassified Nocardia]
MTNLGYQPAVERMAGTLTTPFAAGADLFELVLSEREPLPNNDFEPYDFAEHRARFGTEPRIRYVATAIADLPVDVTMTVGYKVPGDERDVSLVFPAGTPAGASRLIPLGDDTAKALLDNVELRVPQGEANVGVVDHFRFTALLGDLAALLWVLGGDRDILAAQLTKVRSQRSVENATGLSLDLIGSDLSIPRFPPLPYGFAAETIALYHLDDTAAGSTVLDAMTMYTGPGTGHPGTRNASVVAGADGRFGSGMGFAAFSEIAIPDHTDFALPATAGFTAECFVRPAMGDWHGAVLSKHVDTVDQTKPGWSLHIGKFGRGLDRNVQLLLSDGTNKVELYADVSLMTDRFQHIAAVLDRERGLARLYVNGVAVASKPANIGVLTNNSPLRIGFGDPGANGFYGSVDEVRISRGALSGFAPVLGEDDDSYRRRLTLFRRWNLPTPANIANALNETVGPINDVLRPITVSDAFVRTPVGSRTVKVWPTAISPGESVDALGRYNTTEAEVCGRIADDQFDPRWLVDYSDAFVDFAGSERRIRLPLQRYLDALVKLVFPLQSFARLTVSPYDPNATDLRAVGRAVVLRHAEIPAGTLAALALRAGFSWVRHRADTDDVYASISDKSSIQSSWAPYEDVLEIGLGTAPVSVLPPPPAEATVRWSILQAGPGRAELVDDVNTGPQVTVQGVHTGVATLEVEVRLGGKTYSAIQRLKMGPAEFPPDSIGVGQSIGADGTLGVDESVAGTAADGAYSPDYLVAVNDPWLQITVPGSNRMQANVAACLGRVLDQTSFGPQPLPQVRLVTGWTPNGSGLDAVGRALTLAPAVPELSLARLARIAHGAGFDYVENTGTVIRVAQRAGEHLAITGPAAVDEGATASFAMPRHDNPVGAVLAGKVLCTVGQGSSTVSLLDTTSGALLGTVPVGQSPVGIAVSADQKTVFTASGTDHTITAFGIGSPAKVTTGPALSAAPLAIVGHPTKPLLVVLLPTQVVTVDAGTLAVVNQWTIPGSTAGKALALNSTGTTAFVACDDKTLRAVDIDTMTAGAVSALPAAPIAIAVTSTRAYVIVVVPASPGRGVEVDMVIVDLASRAVVRTVFINANEPRIGVDESAGTVYIGDGVYDAVPTYNLDGDFRGPIYALDIPGKPVAIIPSGTRVFVLLRGEIGRGRSDTVIVLTPGPAQRVIARWPVAPAGGNRLVWSVRGADPGAAHLDGSTGELAQLTGDHAGTVQIRARAPIENGNPPYTVVIGLDQKLLDEEKPGKPVVVRRDQYERLMNVLNELHPIGVEFNTKAIRDHVVELRTGQLDSLPAYTYPTYRLRGQHLARPIRKD